MTNRNLNTIKTWTLIPWILFWVFTGKIIFSITGVNDTNLFEMFIYIMIYFWILVQFRKNKVEIIDLSAKYTLKINKLIKIFGVTALIKTCSIFSTILVWNALVLIDSSFTKKITNFSELNATNNEENLIILFLVVVFLAPVVEETFFRGILLNKWCKRFGTIFGILSTSLLFGIIHGTSGFLSAFIGSIFYSLLYLKTRNLLIPIIAHSFGNFMIFLFKFIIVGSSKNTKILAEPVLNNEQIAIIGVVAGGGLLLILLPLLLIVFYKIYPRNEKLPYNL